MGFFSPYPNLNIGEDRFEPWNDGFIMDAALVS